MAMRNALLRHIRVQVGYPIPRVAAPLGHAIRRWISEDLRGTFLDKSEVAERVIRVVKMFEKVDPAKVDKRTTFETLGLDSLDTVEVVMALEEEFGFEIPDNEADKINSIDTAIDYIAAHPQAK